MTEEPRFGAVYTFFKARPIISPYDILKLYFIAKRRIVHPPIGNVSWV